MPWNSHPTWQQWLQALDHPVQLFALSAAQMFLIGCATLISANVVLGPWTEQLTTVLAALIITTTAWRVLLYAKATGQPEPSGIRSGIWLGLGMVAGELIVPQASLGSWLRAEPASLLALLVAACAYAAWVTQCAALLLPPLQLKDTVKLRLAVLCSALTAVLLGLAGMRWPWTITGPSAAIVLIEPRVVAAVQPQLARPVLERVGHYGLRLRHLVRLLIRRKRPRAGGTATRPAMAQAPAADRRFLRPVAGSCPVGVLSRVGWSGAPPVGLRLAVHRPWPWSCRLPVAVLAAARCGSLRLACCGERPRPVPALRSGRANWWAAWWKADAAAG